MTPSDIIDIFFKRTEAARHIGIFTHMNPDGDALGSSFGMAGYLLGRSRKVSIFLPAAPPESLEFMVNPDVKSHIVCYSKANALKVGDCDLIIGVDFNNTYRIGDWEQPLKESKAYKILIDHHVDPDRDIFNTVWSKEEISSASELVYWLLKESPAIENRPDRLSVHTREALLTGMTTDTNNFANSVYPSTLQMASELLASGTDRDSIIRNLFFSYPRRRIAAEGYILHKLLHVTDYGVAYIFLDSRTQTSFGLKEGDTEGFVNIPLSMADVRMSILAKRERKHKKIRISIRSKAGTSARECAMAYFHGGGHELASGGKLIIGEDVEKEQDVCRYIESNTRKFFLQEKDKTKDKK